jgi:BCD family chlorophyll transporter-like MFS transporter
LPVLIAPFRALLGFRSDTYKSAIGWKRVPYLWFGSLWQMGGLAVMPFALIALSGVQQVGPSWAGEVLAALAFLMTGLGLHMTQTAGLALASDLADDETRPRVVALLYVMFLIGMAASALIIGWLLVDFSPLRLIRVVQGAALAGILLNLIALWQQERPRPMSQAERAAPRPLFRDAWADLLAGGRAGRLLVVVFIGTMAFNMQDVLLEPFGGEVLGLSVSATTLLTCYLGGRGAVWLRAGRLEVAPAERSLSFGGAWPFGGAFGLCHRYYFSPYGLGCAVFYWRRFDRIWRRFVRCFNADLRHDYARRRFGGSWACLGRLGRRASNRCRRINRHRWNAA